MISHNEVSQFELECPPSIHRSPTILDLTKLSHQPHSSLSSKRNSVSFSENLPEGYGSETDDFLYMATKRRSNKRSLSAISNQQNRDLDGSFDELELKESTFVQETQDQLSYSVIDREISEWQHVCRTGRPLWWLPESKYTRAKNLNHCSPEPANPRLWSREMDSGPDPEHEMKRRAVSDIYLTDPTCSEDLTRMIAIQLLSSCFTLPPEPLLGPLTPSYSTLDKKSHFRYSPCFGHQPRNPSPAQTWLAAYDGPAWGSSSPSSGTGIQTPIIATSASPARRRRGHRILNLTESPGTSMDTHKAGYWRSRSRSEDHELDTSTVGNRRQRIDDDDARTMFFAEHSSKNRKSKQRQTPSDQDGSVDLEEYDEARERRPHLPKMNYRLQPVLRSEPHPVFIQPVKELVVRRWRSLRRRFGGSMHGALKSNVSDDMPSTASGSGFGSSPAMSSDARIRRLRAQERGYIHSNSAESIQRFNSPVSGLITPDESGAASPYWVDFQVAAPIFQLTDSLVATTASAIVESEDKVNTTPESSYSVASLPPRPPPPNTLDSTLAASANGPPVLQAFILPKPITTASNRSFSSRKSKEKARRKSMLSEMQTPEDFTNDANPSGSCHADGERNALSVAGSALASPKLTPELNLLVIANSRAESISDHSDSLREGGFHEKLHKRPRMARTSTTGTQIFNPSHDGVELDGLPVGPDRHVWDGNGKRREQTYL